MKRLSIKQRFAPSSSGLWAWVGGDTCCHLLPLPQHNAGYSCSEHLRDCSHLIPRTISKTFLGWPVQGTELRFLLGAGPRWAVAFGGRPPHPLAPPHSSLCRLLGFQRSIPPLLLVLGRGANGSLSTCPLPCLPGLLLSFDLPSVIFSSL